MLSRSARLFLRKPVLTAACLRTIGSTTPVLTTVRFNSTSNIDTSKKIQTNLFDDLDPSRDFMFQYSWGTWLKNDKLEKRKRFTKFSIQGLNNLFNQINELKVKNDEISQIDDSLIKVLNSNISYFFKDIKEGSKIYTKQIISAHEGKHHRLYKIEIEGSEKSLMLRLPYSLGSKLFTRRKVESEVATMDFLSNMLNLNLPRVLAYSGDYNNSIQHPFILMEYVEDVESSLMKKWNPLVDSKEDRLDDNETKMKLDQVIEPISDFNKIVTDFVFSNFGSLYFKSDVTEGMKTLEAFKDQNRWVIGPTVESAYYRNKKLLTDDEINKFVGPWKNDEPLKMVEDLCELELLNLSKRLELINSGKEKAFEEDNKEDLEMSIKIFTRLNKISGELFNLNKEESLIPYVESLVKPRLHIEDLDPMNVLIQKDDKGFKFIDFESSSVKPFLISNYPKFIEYNGVKIFNLREEIENFDELDDLEKEQYKFIFKRTRNQFYWEVLINKNNKELIGVISPVIKLIKNCYSNVLNFKKLKDSLYIENGLIEISSMWENYNENGIIGKYKGEPNPNKFSEAEIKEFSERIQEYEIENSSKPFIATNGWVPQDMFKKLEEQGMIIRDDEKDEWIVDTEKVLK